MNARARDAPHCSTRARDDSGRLFDSSRARTIVDAPA
jgi:hypothetical protein